MQATERDYDSHPTPFDSEDAPDILRAVFDRVEVRTWDAPLITLSDQDSIRDYLIARFVPPLQAALTAQAVSAPVRLTKRGALVIGHRSGAT